ERSDEEYQRIAAEFNLSETAIPLPLDGASFKTAERFSLRWFTPITEVNLCGHATLATSHVIFKELGNKHETIFFETKSGELAVKKVSEGCYELNFPLYRLKSLKFPGKVNPLADKFDEIEAPSFILEVIKKLGLESKFIGALHSPTKKCIVVLEENTTKDELLQVPRCPDELMMLHPDGSFITGVVVTFKPKDPVATGFVDKNGKPYDYVSRYFAPWNGLTEDPATGSSHCVLAELWSRFFESGKELYAFQCYPKRGAQFFVNPQGDRVRITGEAVTIVKGSADF
uniref:Phenazine biosynthesis-like domain-containing protein n=1 Tax=Steinernema glaseri TaxID=37863 RepID=A0A1I8AAW2_9BILA